MKKLYAKGRSYYAEAVLNGNKFIVIKGSRISPETKGSVSESVRNLRADKDVVSGDSLLLNDIEFTSASTAASFVGGTMLNGYKFWKYYDSTNYLNKEDFAPKRGKA